MIVSFCFTSHKYGSSCGREGINKISGRYLHRDRPLANIYVNNQKVLFRMHIRG